MQQKYPDSPTKQGADNNAQQHARESILWLSDREYNIQLPNLASAIGHLIHKAPSLPEAVEIARRYPCAVAVVSMANPEAEISAMHSITAASPSTEIILLSTRNSPPTYEGKPAPRLFDVLPSHPDLPLLTHALRQAIRLRAIQLQNQFQLRSMERALQDLRHRVLASGQVLIRRLASVPPFMGDSEIMARLRQQVAEAAPSRQAILLLGETGTGKDIAARIIHEWSGRSPQAFLKISCPLLSEPFLRSELFGQESVPLPGSERRRPGRFEQAANGTVFLEEIGQIPLGLQDDLLRALRTGAFQRVGSTEPIPLECRIIASTRYSIEDRVKQGAFRVELFDWLRQCSIALPPLRLRPEDIPALARHFLARMSTRLSKPDLDLSPAALAALCRHSWPGNIRELETSLRRFAVSGSEEKLLEELGETWARQKKSTMPRLPAPAENSLRSAEVQAILRALAQTRWNQRRAAQLLGISYSALRRRIAKYSLKTEPTAGTA